MDTAIKAAARAAIESSPLWKLPREERRAMMEKGHPGHKQFIEMLFAMNDYLFPGWESAGSSQKYEPSTIFLAFRDFFANYPPTGTGAINYYCQTLKHRRSKEFYLEQDSLIRTDRTVGRNLRKLRAYMASNGIGAGTLYHNNALAEDVAKTLGITTKALRNALCFQDDFLRLDKIEGDDTGDKPSLLDQIPDKHADMEAAAFPQDAALVSLCDLLAGQGLEEKEAFAKKYGACWSDAILTYLRGGEKANRAERLAQCDALRPIEQKRCLWDCLLLHAYVEFLVAEPPRPDTLPTAALNSLADPTLRPGFDKTILTYINTVEQPNAPITKSGMSRRKAKWERLRADLLARITEE